MLVKKVDARRRPGQAPLGANLGAKRLKIAVIGSGIAGLGTVYGLVPAHDVTLFEARSRLGGHSRTVIAGRNKHYAVDTGFMVFNMLNYPKLNTLFDELNIPIKRSNMSFAVSLDDGKFEYGLHQLSRIFADKRNLVRPSFYKMLLEIFKFNKHCLKYKDDPNATLGDMLANIGLSTMFRERYLCPLAGAIWSTSVDDMMDFPAQTLVRFFSSHKLNSASDHPTWYTIDGGSKIYVERMAKYLKNHGCKIQTNTPVTSVSRQAAKTVIHTPKGEPQIFDHVVFACHADQALALLAQPTQDEQSLLGAIRFKKNRVYVHDDPAQMPLRKACWSSWVYKGSRTQTKTNATTYWMNSLQDIPDNTPVFVTLNPQTPIKDYHIFDETTLSHPQYDLAALRARENLHTLQGVQNTWYCGAWTKYGFHEDGLGSGLQIAQDLQVSQASVV